MDKEQIKNVLLKAVLSLNSLSFKGEELEQALQLKRGLESLHDTLAQEIDAEKADKAQE